MKSTIRSPGIRAGRLSADEYDRNFADLHPPLAPHEAAVEADRCYFCHDAPCVTACPTGIDIPLFIRQIRTGNPGGAAETIFDQNILGGICARVCPTETLCEQACVRNDAETKPVRIGMLQRHATDHALSRDLRFETRAAATGKRVAIVGGGPAGLSCAHRLAAWGHDVVIFDARDKLGGLNEYGIAAYKTVDEFAQREVDYILAIGGISVEGGTRLGDGLTLAQLRSDFDAVFVGVGLGTVNQLGLKGEDLDGVVDAVDYIADLRQAPDLSALPVGRNVVVIGGGMTAIDIAVQTKRLGAETVTLVYRKGRDAMKASEYERHVATESGVVIREWAAPKAFHGGDGKLASAEFEYQATNGSGSVAPTGETFQLNADQVFKAIGQALAAEELADAGLTVEAGRIAVDDRRRTTLQDVWAGGDCIALSEDLTVAAVEDGKIAAASIHETLQQ